MLPKAIFFDLDDTIISFDASTDIAWNKVCKDFCIANPTYEFESFLRKISKVRNWYWSDSERHKIGRQNMQNARREIVKMAFDNMGIHDENMAMTLADNYTSLQLEFMELFPRSLDTLEYFTKHCVSLSLLTNGGSDSQRYKINRFGLEKYFKYIYIEGEVGFGKPDRRVYEKALADLRLEPEEVWMVGDNLGWDIQPAKEMGIFSIWVDFKGKGLDISKGIRPDKIINNIYELTCL